MADKQACVLFFGKGNPGRLYRNSSRALQAMEDKKKLVSESLAKSMYIEKYSSYKEAMQVLESFRKTKELKNKQRMRCKQIKRGSLDAPQTEQPQSLQVGANEDFVENSKREKKRATSDTNNEASRKKKKKTNLIREDTVENGNSTTLVVNPINLNTKLIASVEPLIKENNVPDMKTMKASVEVLMNTQAELEGEVSKIVQKIHGTTDRLEKLKAISAAVERQISKLEAEKTKSLEDTINQVPKNSKLHEELGSDLAFDSNGYCIVFTNAKVVKHGGGIGVFFGDKSEYNIGEPCRDFISLKNMIKQRKLMQFLAAALACHLVKLLGVTKINIHTSCDYLQTCVKNLPTWMENGWIWQKSNKPVTDNLKNVLTRLNTAMQGLDVKWTLVNDDVAEVARVHGNVMAERLALDEANKNVSRES